MPSLVKQASAMSDRVVRWRLIGGVEGDHEPCIGLYTLLVRFPHLVSPQCTVYSPSPVCWLGAGQQGATCHASLRLSAGDWPVVLSSVS